MKKIPVTILTGFLGSGKTTLLNHILTAKHGKKIAVIVNEIGKVGIDNQLVMNTDEEVMEMTNGCICCSVRGDLLVALKKLLQAEKEFEAVVIETTGLASPGPIIGTFFLDPVVQEAYNIDGVITVVDSYHIKKHLEKGIEAGEQIAFADRILMNKVDLIEGEEAGEIETLLHSLNPTATVIRSKNTEVDVEDLLHIGTFSMKDKLELHNVEHDGGHLKDITSFVIREERPLNMQQVNEWMTAVVEMLGENLYRYKGILSVKGTDKRVVFQGVHSLFAGKIDREWREGEERVSELVFIGKDLNKAWFEEHIRDCVAK
ncbi:CobW family GTP-binding protein [Priestia taiwanensis]|uniref:Zinc transporter n=1 Tax=Priestia taiwanensis TaxID=1347902 RepID=A0A917EMT0_9BACI|nr:GTP-binding protein [Priestia taiwanensis]GGE57636.1 zinc transporter [Priestia taiwanensis]